ncbi:MAG: hypothetical protein UT24_C0011G0046 [Candidatus Woesebacteria bacterium GW2011_GWB1_39_12]|uniref:Uncharacterized protein n=1 Tax=Candidatus Woesebacteria bacterium GW2011_GWB1_39_12 TaxID=1618574 RepID=A0A0G0MBP1_9BACT|nr:MAG: hypothetical protein UT24_C0011G0046 [Candidatus Woesebacteria bacterium GW2011_GWB1_39_12]
MAIDSDQTALEFVAESLFAAKFYEAEGYEALISTRPDFKGARRNHVESKKIRKQMERVERWIYATAFQGAITADDKKALDDPVLLCERYAKNLTYVQYLEDKTDDYET